MEPTDLQALTKLVNELLVLSTLGGGGKHGYQIALDVEERSGGVFGFRHGTLYPILHRLEEEGATVAAWEGRRKVYALTEAGRARLAEGRLECRRVFEVLDGMLEEADVTV